MAPVVFPHPVSYAAVAAPCIHVTSAVYLTYTVIASLLTSRQALGPPQDTRTRTAKRSKLVPVFVSLSILALSVACFSAADGAILSYKVWADQHGVKLPQSWSGQKSTIINNDAELYLGQWLTDTPIYQDTLEIVAERSRRFWWGQQIDLATLSWSMLLAVEGRRRGIRNLPAFLTLAHLVNLSYAQNLFYLAMLITPAPLSNGQQDLVLPTTPVPGWTRLRRRLLASKPSNWHPRPFVLYGSMATGFGSILLLPYAAGTSSFAIVAALARASTFLPVLAPYIVPRSWGQVYTNPHEGYASLATLFRTISAASLMLHYKSTAVSLADNAPDSHRHRHSSLLLPWDNEEERSRWERGTTAFGKVLGSVSDHPAVQGVGFDVLVSTFSLGVWAAVRAVDVGNILKLAVPLAGKTSNVVPAVGGGDEHDSSKSLSSDRQQETSNTLTRRRTRGGHPSKAASPPSSEPEEDDDSQDTYRPTKAEMQSITEGDVELPADELLDWEAGALSWGLTALCGLGAASSGVFGAECMAR